MSVLATVVNVVNTDSAPNYIIAEYVSSGIGADTTSDLIELKLLARNRSQFAYRNVPDLTKDGKAYAIELLGFSISCNSTNFDVSILNKGDISLLNTINEIIKYTGINLSESDLTFEQFMIRNRDDILDNSIYLHINNHDLIATGNIRIELSYIVTQDNIEF